MIEERAKEQSPRDKAQKVWDAACSAYFIGPAGRGTPSASRKYWRAVKIIAAAISDYDRDRWWRAQAEDNLRRLRVAEEEVARGNETIEAIAHTRNQAQEFVHLVAEKGNGFLADVAKSLINEWFKDRPTVARGR